MVIHFSYPWINNLESVDHGGADLKNERNVIGLIKQSNTHTGSESITTEMHTSGAQ